MKNYFAWKRAAAVVVAGAGVFGTSMAVAQYPYSTQPPQAQSAMQPYGAWRMPGQDQAAGTAPALPSQQGGIIPQGPYPQTQAAPVTGVAAQASAPQVATQQFAPQASVPQATQQAGTVAALQSQNGIIPQGSYQRVAAQYPAGYPTYPMVARQPEPSVPPPQPTAANGAEPVAPANGAANGATQSAPANGVHNGQNGHANSYPNGYPQSGGYPATGDCGCDNHSDYGLSHYFDQSHCDNMWFGGVYGLFMERNNPTRMKLSVEVDHAVAPDPYYPPAAQTMLSVPEHDFTAGLEVRFGSTFTVGPACNSCGSGCSTGCGNGCATGCGGCGCAEMYAWEFGAWALDEDNQYALFVDMPATRMYGMKDFVGLQFDRNGTATWRPVNDYYGYNLPIPAPPGVPADGYVAVLAQAARTNFDAQNMELNIVHFPMCQSSCGGCASGCGSDCGGDACCSSGSSMFGSCGVRYFRTDEGLMFATEFAEVVGGVYDQAAFDGFTYDNANELIYNVDVENQLIGPQVGWTMNYNWCKWNFFLNSAFGVFNNHMNQVQRMWSGGGGGVQFAGTGDDFYVRSSKDDVAFLGELRAGGSYDITCNWRAVLAYRVVAISGVANAVDQVPGDFTNQQWVAQIDSDNSMVVHGVQTGVECRY